MVSYTDYYKDYYQKNKEKYKKSNLKYRIKKKGIKQNICLTCGKEFVSKKFSTKVKFCSVKCTKIFYQNNDKQKQYMKKYGIKYRKTKQFKDSTKKWREKNKKKENIKCLTTYYRNEIIKIKKPVCEICGSNKNIELHHKEYNIKPSRDRNKTIKLLCKNIEILCRNCHRKHHRKYVLHKI